MFASRQIKLSDSPGSHPVLDILEEGGVNLVEWVDVAEEQVDRLLGHVLLFAHLVPEPLKQ